MSLIATHLKIDPGQESEKQHTEMQFSLLVFSISRVQRNIHCREFYPNDCSKKMYSRRSNLRDKDTEKCAASETTTAGIANSYETNQLKTSSFSWHTRHVQLQDFIPHLGNQCLHWRIPMSLTQYCKCWLIDRFISPLSVSLLGFKAHFSAMVPTEKWPLVPMPKNLLHTQSKPTQKHNPRIYHILMLCCHVLPLLLFAVSR